MLSVLRNVFDFSVDDSVNNEFTITATHGHSDGVNALHLCTEDRRSKHLKLIEDLMKERELQLELKLSPGHKNLKPDTKHLTPTLW